MAICATYACSIRILPFAILCMSDVARAERLKQQAEFIRAVREEEALAFRQAKRVDGGASEEALFHIDK